MVLIVVVVVLVVKWEGEREGKSVDRGGGVATVGKMEAGNGSG